MDQWVIRADGLYLNENNDYYLKNEIVYLCNSKESAYKLLEEIEKNKDGKYSKDLKNYMNWQVDLIPHFNF